MTPNLVSRCWSCFVVLLLLAAVTTTTVHASSAAAAEISSTPGKELESLFYYASHQVDDYETEYTLHPRALSPAQRMSIMQSRNQEVFASATGKLGGAFDFIPAYKGTLKLEAGAEELSYEGKCFNSYRTTLSQVDSDTLVVEMKAVAPRDLLCSDTFLLAYPDQFLLKWIYFAGTHKLTLSHLNSTDVENIRDFGLQVFEIDESVILTLADILETVLLFKGPWTNADALNFLKTHMNITYADRTEGEIPFKEDDIPDGTYFATQRFDGSEIMIQYGTGSYSGHSTVAVRLDGVLHVCESTDKNSPDYWPPPYGVICHVYSEWMELAKAAHYSVSFMPLHPTLQAKYNSTAAQEFIASVRGLPYGYHNFIYGWIDTPTDNLPPPMSVEFLAVAFTLYGHISPELANRIYIVGLNKRLNVNCTDMECIWSVLDSRQLNFSDVITYPEQDDWVYYDGKSMVCDVFVLEIYKAAGIFDVEIQATEFTPKDLYTLGIFDGEFKSHFSQCPSQPEQVCQVMGDYVAQFPAFNSIPPYDHMCERCPSKWPDYIRPPGC